MDTRAEQPSAGTGDGQAGTAPGGGRRLLLAAFGDPGHAFPMLALGQRLVARGHQVTLETWRRWREFAEATGMAFAPAPEYEVFPRRSRPLKPYAAALRAATETRPLLADLRPDAVVADILTLAPALAGELEGVPVATLVPHVFPLGAAGFPPYSLGARLPRTVGGRLAWRLLERPLARGLNRGREQLNETRARLGLAPLDWVHGGISRQLCLVATFPQLEYPRAWPPWTRVVGPLMWEPRAEAVEPPPGQEPLVLVAPSTSQDRRHRLLRAALAGLADLPVRVLGATNRRGEPLPAIDVPANARLVDWLSYGRIMPACDVVVCHGGHGTVVRALTSGSAPVICPAAGDMNENAARVDWAGLGTRLPGRFCTPRGVRLAVERTLADAAIRTRVAEVAAWASTHDAATSAAIEIESFVSRQTPAQA